MQILVVDDNSSNRDLLKLLIEEWFEDNHEEIEYQLYFANNGKEALDMMGKTNYEIVFLDIMMPILDGFTVLEKLNRKSFKDKPKIILSSAIINDKKNKVKAKDLKANGFLVKPICLNSLDAILSRYIKTENYQESDDIFDDFMDVEDRNLSASDFLARYSDDIINYEAIYEHEDLVNNLLFHIEEDKEFDLILIEVTTLLKDILSSFLEFTEIEDIIKELENIIYTLEHIQIDKSKIDKGYMFKLFLAIVEDLYNWEKVVFIDKNTDNINYINNSLVNSYIMIKKGLDDG